jgi:hypothetical protein
MKSPLIILVLASAAFAAAPPSNPYLQITNGSSVTQCALSNWTVNLQAIPTANPSKTGGTLSLRRAPDNCSAILWKLYQAATPVTMDIVTTSGSSSAIQTDVTLKGVTLTQLCMTGVSGDCIPAFSPSTGAGVEQWRLNASQMCIGPQPGSSPVCVNLSN